jgi:hypothetical protein
MEARARFRLQATRKTGEDQIHRIVFNRWRRGECLNVNQFPTIEDIKIKMKKSRLNYNHDRPHGSLGYLAPREFIQPRQDSGIGEATETQSPLVSEWEQKQRAIFFRISWSDNLQAGRSRIIKYAKSCRELLPMKLPDMLEVPHLRWVGSWDRVTWFTSQP